MIELRKSDVFKERDIEYVVHQTNLYHTFGSGIAKDIRLNFPWAYEADRNTRYGAREKLGTFGFAPNENFPTKMGLGTQYLVGIFNMYSQDGISATDRMTNYAAMGYALLGIEKYLCEQRATFDGKKYEYPILGIPKGIGCGLGGGNWGIVYPIIDSVFAKSPVLAIVCEKV